MENVIIIQVLYYCYKCTIRICYFCSMAAKLKTEISAARGGERPAPYSTTCRAGRGQIVHHLGIQRKENHGLEGMDALPYIDLIDPSVIDLLLISHFHLDHCGGMPWLQLQRENLDDPCHPGHLLLSD
ncbi:hypothetical protein J4Q44_G00247910 [Coregonus suidteri]|uniref:Metallo-beta-lactamase domain-containing protein n=1 Tax=Coregonus suidteri TaxID=861788 RepID=A0AAN8QGT7_9TELE